jgi:hypothetical protein
VNFGPQGRSYPLSGRPFVLPNIRECSPLGWTKGWTILLGDKVHPWGEVYPQGLTSHLGSTNVVKNWPLLPVLNLHVTYMFVVNHIKFAMCKFWDWKRFKNRSLEIKLIADFLRCEKCIVNNASGIPLQTKKAFGRCDL